MNCESSWLTIVVGGSLLFLLTLMYAVSVWKKQRSHLKAYAAVQVVQSGV